MKNGKWIKMNYKNDNIYHHNIHTEYVIIEGKHYHAIYYLGENITEVGNMSSARSAIYKHRKGLEKVRNND